MSTGSGPEPAWIAGQHACGADTMSLTPTEVAHIAELAKLELTREEEELYLKQLSAILDYASALQRINTAAIPPTATVLPLRSVMREDVVEPSMPREDVLANAPDPFDGFFRVRAILEES
jgi:aspartyl-tRNA(Asn)/glutamyl-tRNA(Gln) amidotransferase subunit C